MTDGGVIVGQRLCGEWKSTRPRPGRWRIIFLITFWRPLKRHRPVPRNTHYRGNTAKLVPFHRAPDTHDGEMRLAKNNRDCVCTALSKCLRNSSCSQYGTCYVGGSHRREKLGFQCAITLPPAPKAESSSGYFPLPGCRKVQRSAPPTITSAKHQPNTIWQNHLRLSSFRQSVVLA